MTWLIERGTYLIFTVSMYLFIHKDKNALCRFKDLHGWKKNYLPLGPGTPSNPFLPGAPGPPGKPGSPFGPDRPFDPGTPGRPGGPGRPKPGSPYSEHVMTFVRNVFVCQTKVKKDIT